jgi:pimeloyl-ACP methyl ester carboxylesterase
MNTQKDIVLIPGAWMGAWAWESVAERLRTLGHRAHPVTLPGLNDEADVSGISLETHVEHVLSILETNDLRDAIIVGHSYSGIVAGQVGDRAPDRVAHTVFVDAFLPRDGKSMLDAFPKPQRDDELRQIAENGGRWPKPDLEGALDGHGLSAEQARWLVNRLVDHPGRTVSEPAPLTRPLSQQQATYIACSFEDSEEVAAMRHEPTWTFRTLKVGHWPMVAAPDELTALLAEAASEHSR